MQNLILLPPHNKHWHFHLLQEISKPFLVFCIHLECFPQYLPQEIIFGLPQLKYASDNPRMQFLLGVKEKFQQLDNLSLTFWNKFAFLSIRLVKLFYQLISTFVLHTSWGD